MCAIFLTGCVKNPVTGEREMALISQTQEVQIGKEAFRTATQAQGGEFTADPELSKYVSEVGHRVAKESARPNLPYEFIIVNDSVPNAWTLPGGKIAINRGLLTELHTEAELAAVLGHEIVHADARHGAKGIERGLLLQGGVVALGVAMKDNAYNDVLVGAAGVGAMLVSSKYSRNQELESDRYGMIYMAKAGYNPEAAVHLQEIFLKLSKGDKTPWLAGLFASHPPSQERIIANQKTARELATSQDMFDGREEYQAHMARLCSHKDAYDKEQEGQKALRKKNYSQARKLGQEAIDSFADEALFWQLKGEALLGEKKAKEAITAFNEAISRNPNHFAFYLKRAEAKKLIGDSDGARNDAQKSIALLPTGEGHELMGKLLLKAGRTRLAVQHLQLAAHAKSPAGERARALLKKLTN
jgi:predicted Zn-dependent protease